MALDPERRYPGRLIDVGAGTPVYAIACGKSACDGTTARHAARLVDVRSGVPLYATASDGCQVPLDLAAGLSSLDTTCVTEADVRAALALSPFMVEKASIAPHGMSRVLRAELKSSTGCGDQDCRGAYLLYHEPGELTPPAPCTNDTTLGVWYGCFTAAGGTRLPVHVYYIPDAAAGLRWKACVGGLEDFPVDDCRSPIEGVISLDACTLTNVGVVTVPISAQECCECPDGQLSLVVRSFCGPYRPARFVGVSGGVKVFAVADCLPPPSCSGATDCCAVLTDCPLTLTLEADDACCADLDGSYTLHPTGTGQWSTFPGGPISACSRNWTFELECSGNQLTLTGFNTDVGATCTSDSPTADLTRPCWPVDETFRLTFTCNFGNPAFPDKCTPGLTATVTT